MTGVRADRRSLEDVDEARWTQLLLAAPEATPFHSLAWGRALLALPRTTVHVLVIEEAGDYRAGMLCATSDRGPLRTVSSLPFGTYGGPLVAQGADPAACVAPLAAALIDGLSARTSLDVTDWGGHLRALLPGARALECATRVLDLSEPYPRLVATCFAPAVRQKIRQAERDGVRVVRDHAPEHVAGFLRLLRTAYERHESVAPPEALYEAAIREMIPRGDALLSHAVLADGAIAGAALHLRAGAHVFNWLTAIDPARARHRPANALVDDAIRWAYETRASLYNFGATPPGAPGVDAFKKAWGAVPRPYTAYRVDGAAMRWARSVRDRLARSGGA